MKKKNLLITGASTRIGREIALHFSKKGWNIAIHYFNSKSEANVLKKNVEKNKVKVILIKADLKNKKQVDNIFPLAKKGFGTIDCLVNNAGVAKDNLTIRMSLEEWTKVIDINLTSTFLMSKYSIKKMLKNKSGKIINITSVVGHTGNVGQANYTASKAGIVAMSKSLAIEYAKKNINVNCISPGFISTAMTDQIDEKFKETIVAKIPSNRLGKPEDIANVVIFLSSNQSDYINGETIHVNGGMYMG